MTNFSKYGAKKLGEELKSQIANPPNQLRGGAKDTSREVNCDFDCHWLPKLAIKKTGLIRSIAFDGFAM